MVFLGSFIEAWAPYQYKDCLSRHMESHYDDLPLQWELQYRLDGIFILRRARVISSLGDIWLVACAGPSH